MKILVVNSISEVIDKIAPHEDEIYLIRGHAEYRDISELLKHSTLYDNEDIACDDIIIVKADSGKPFEVWSIASEVILKLKTNVDSSTHEVSLNYTVKFSNREPDPDNGEHKSYGTISVKMD